MLQCGFQPAYKKKELAHARIFIGCFCVQGASDGIIAKLDLCTAELRRRLFRRLEWIEPRMRRVELRIRSP
jgi:hypothetical protein